MTELERARERIVFARDYTRCLLDGVGASQWFRMPPAGISHVAWQVGHLAYVEYRLVIMRLCGPQAERELLPEGFGALFGARSTPDADASRYPDVETIRAAFDRVHARALGELAACAPARLDEANDPPHPYATTKLECLYWCSSHEMLHGGQIGLLRRQLGCQPLW
jgi:hypothetical protein